jgi:hypothetical protein
MRETSPLMMWSNSHLPALLGEFIAALFWEALSNFLDVSAILLERVTSFSREGKCRMWLSLDELFGYFDIPSVF